MFQQMMSRLDDIRTDMNTSGAAVAALDVKFDKKISALQFEIDMQPVSCFHFLLY